MATVNHEIDTPHVRNGLMHQWRVRQIVRVAALPLLVVGFVQLVITAIDFPRHLGPRKSTVEFLEPFLQSLHLGLWLLGLWAIVCVFATRPRLSMRATTSFDFQATIDGFLLHESWAHRIRRCAVGTGLILLAIGLGPCWRMVEDGVFQGAGVVACLFVPGMLILNFAVVVFRLRCLIAGLRRWAPRAETLLLSRRRPVLYLRSFETDKRAKPWEASSMFLGWLLGWLPETYERSLAKAVADIGPLVAVGEPRERLPPLGAARLYVRDGDEWQRVVAELVLVSRLVILRVGRTEGFWWEFKHLVETCDPKKVLIYLPHEDHGALYGYLRERAGDVVAHPFPNSPHGALFLAFDDDWSPQLLGLRGPSLAAQFRRLVAGSPAPAVREALNGAEERLGRNARPLPLQFREWVVLGVLALSFFWALAQLLLML